MNDELVVRSTLCTLGERMDGLYALYVVGLKFVLASFVVFLHSLWDRRLVASSEMKFHVGWDIDGMVYVLKIGRFRLGVL